MSPENRISTRNCCVAAVPSRQPRFWPVLLLCQSQPRGPIVRGKPDRNAQTWIRQVAILLAAALASASSCPAQESFFQPHDRIAIVGNTLAERMQWDGWLETFLHLRHPDHNLVIRNFGFSGDEVGVRLRSKGFGTMDEHLTRFKADVVLLFFGFNESFRGPDQADEFQAEYTAEIRRMLEQKYNGESPPRIVIVSPIACEDKPPPMEANSSQINLRLPQYVEACRNSALATGSRWIDLFSPTEKAFQASRRQLTIKGIHLLEEGNRLVATMMVDQLCGPNVEYPADSTGLVRSAVRDLNRLWFHSYRTTDGYSIFGDRGELQFTDGQTNREVLTRELEILSAMAEARDPVVWAAAKGKKIEPDESTVPKPIQVITNIPGELPGGEHRFLDPEAAIGKMKPLEGFEVQLFASEKDFPELVNPVQMSFDTRGRLWVAVWRTYPHWQPGTPMDDKLLILEDTNGDGRADKCTPFATGLHNPTGFEFHGDGVMIAAQPDLIYLEDTDGDDRADVRERILHGIDSADTHHAANSFTLGPDGALYFQEGTFHHTQIETPWGPVRSANAASYRFEPATWRLSVYTPYPYANPHGHVFDEWGQDILTDGTGSEPYDAAIISGHLDHPAKHRGAPRVYAPRTRPCPATEFVSSRNFPAEMNGEYLVANVIGDLGILRYRISENGSTIKGDELEPLLLSSDPRFRPVDLEFAPDGSLYFLDWHNPIIGHMQHNLRDPSRDRTHGRVYRVVKKAGSLVAPKPEAGLTVSELVDRLLDPASLTRDLYRVRIELTGRPDHEVVAEIETRLAGDPGKNERQSLLLLWLSQQVQRIDWPLVERLCGATEPRVRVAAVRVLTDWVGRDEPAGTSRRLLIQTAGDGHPRVRLMAARGASFLPGDEGLEVIAGAAAGSRDEAIDYVLEESLRAMPRDWKERLGSMPWLAGLPAASQEFLFARLSGAELVRLPLTDGLARHLLLRQGILPESRSAAIRHVANVEGCRPAEVIVRTLSDPAAMETASRSVMGELAMQLAGQPAEDLGAVRESLERLAFESESPALRRTGMLGMIQADGSVDPVFDRVQNDPQRLESLAGVLEVLTDTRLQQQLFDRLAGALKVPSPELLAALNDPARALATAVRITLPGDDRILTLAEVEVLNSSGNIAGQGIASQSSTAFAGVASRGIDGNTSGVYGDGGQTHSVETTSSPWWQVQLAQPAEIERIVVWNRTEENFARRLDGFTLEVLGAGGEPLFVQRDIPGPDGKIELPVDCFSRERKLRRALLEGLSQVRSRENEAFALLRDEFLGGEETAVAARGLLRTRREAWPADAARPLAERVLALVSGLTDAEKESDWVGPLVETGQLAVSLLPESERGDLASRLSRETIPVLTVGTRPHRMEYDRTLIVCEPGRRIVLTLENTDEMPHNLVLVQPGQLEALGLAAEKESVQPEAQKRGYVPQSEHVIAATKLIQPGDSGRLSLNAPTVPGVYPFVCTYPGHWRRMTGALYVVPDPAAFLAKPQEYCEAMGIRIQDELLRQHASRVEWKVDDFVEALATEPGEGAPAGLAERDFDRGRSLFRTASCASCHKLQGDGFELGPDLAKLDPAWTPAEMLKHILIPSEKIDDKYRTQILLLASGQTVNGIVTGEDDSAVTLTDNPLQATATRVVPQDEIDDRSVSPVSMMPLGLLDTLGRNDVLDLLAYLWAKGDAEHPLYRQTK